MSGNRKKKALLDAAENALRAGQMKAQGMTLKAAGRDAEAAAALREALILDPSLADVHFTLAIMARTKPGLKLRIEEVNRAVRDKDALTGAYEKIVRVMKDRRQYAEAVLCHEEICRLRPDDPIAHGDLGLVLNLAGRHEDAAAALARAVVMAPQNRVLKPLFCAGIGHVHLKRFHEDVRKALRMCFDDIYGCNLSRAFSTWRDTVVLAPETASLRAGMVLSGEKLDSWAKTEASAPGGGVFGNRFFLDGLRLLIMADPVLESFLTGLRRFLCLNADDLDLRPFEPFLCALAEQCFYNEFVFSPSPEEQAAARALAGDAASLSPAKTALLACYEPLCKTFAQRPSLPPGAEYGALLKTQFDDPQEEDRLKQGIPAFGAIANAVSQAVRSQYEENPYPRWVSASTAPSPMDDVVVPEDWRLKPCRILVAGCGTGRQAFYAATKHPNAAVTAIDLSRASIAYGLRKTREAGIADRIEFVHADILSMADWPETFDIIECSGVLHHMADPFEGWRVLNGKLKPGGFFNIGLYSEAARQHIVAARALIAEKGYEATPEGIRACRRDIMSLPRNNPMRVLADSHDFYATSLVRDLIFHVQEHRLTLPQIAQMMEKLDLECVRFTITSADVMMKYARMFPDDPDRKNIGNWIKFEEKFPRTFAGMYQFWAQKKKEKKEE